MTSRSFSSLHMELHIHVYRHHPDAAIRRQSTSSVPLALFHMNTPLLAQVFMLIYVYLSLAEKFPRIHQISSLASLALRTSLESMKLHKSSLLLKVVGRSSLCNLLALVNSWYHFTCIGIIPTQSPVCQGWGLTLILIVCVVSYLISV